MRKLSLLFLALLLALTVLAPGSRSVSAEDRGGLANDARIAPSDSYVATAPTASATTAPVVGSYSRIANYGSLNMRTGPGSSYSVIRYINKGEIVKVISGPHNTYWYKVSYRGQVGYQYAKGLAHTGLAGQSIANARAGKVIVVSRVRQQMEAYQDGKLVLVAAITTGRPETPTPLGSTTVLYKKRPLYLTSPYPKGHPYYYEPKTVEYGLAFRYNGYLFHDAPWAPYKGYGTNVPHVDPDGVTRTGSLGCVRSPVWALATLYSWAPVGTPVHIIDR